MIATMTDNEIAISPLGFYRIPETGNTTFMAAKPEVIIFYTKGAAEKKS